MSVAPGA